MGQDASGLAAQMIDIYKEADESVEPIFNKDDMPYIKATDYLATHSAFGSYEQCQAMNLFESWLTIYEKQYQD